MLPSVSGSCSFFLLLLLFPFFSYHFIEKLAASRAACLARAWIPRPPVAKGWLPDHHHHLYDWLLRRPHGIPPVHLSSLIPLDRCGSC